MRLEQARSTRRTCVERRRAPRAVVLELDAEIGNAEPIARALGPLDEQHVGSGQHVAETEIVDRLRRFETIEIAVHAARDRRIRTARSACTSDCARARVPERRERPRDERRLAAAELAGERDRRRRSSIGQQRRGQRAPRAHASPPHRRAGRLLRIDASAQLGDDVAGDHAALAAACGEIARLRVHVARPRARPVAALDIARRCPRSRP